MSYPDKMTIINLAGLVVLGFVIGLVFLHAGGT
jgi:hypothetical protein